jgi:hypothetical protein
MEHHDAVAVSRHGSICRNQHVLGVAARVVHSQAGGEQFAGAIERGCWIDVEKDIYRPDLNGEVVRLADPREPDNAIIVSRAGVQTTEGAATATLHDHFSNRWAAAVALDKAGRFSVAAPPRRVAVGGCYSCNAALTRFHNPNSEKRLRQNR